MEVTDYITADREEMIKKNGTRKGGKKYKTYDDQSLYSR